uniref:C2H2-type domain-containing protein n=1 Tax=Cacopsylla melanoneura TaxID=428564 RepID=A0A8D9A070_9HEMI
MEADYYVKLYYFKFITNNKMLKVIFRDFISGPLTCQNCKQELLADFQFVMEHCRICDFVSRPNQAYTFVCFQCDYHSRFESHMKRHVSVHLGVKPFKWETPFYLGSDFI